MRSTEVASAHSAGSAGDLLPLLRSPAVLQPGAGDGNRTMEAFAQDFGNGEGIRASRHLVEAFSEERHGDEPAAFADDPEAVDLGWVGDIFDDL